MDEDEERGERRGEQVEEVPAQGTLSCLSL